MRYLLGAFILAFGLNAHAELTVEAGVFESQNSVLVLMAKVYDQPMRDRSRLNYFVFARSRADKVSMAISDKDVPQFTTLLRKALSTPLPPFDATVEVGRFTADKSDFVVRAVRRGEVATYVVGFVDEHAINQVHFFVNASQIQEIVADLETMQVKGKQVLDYATQK